MKQAYEDIKDLNFGEGPAQIGPYLRQWLKANEIELVMAMARPELPPSLYALLHKAQPTTAAVERAFSMLGNVFTEDRPFEANSVTAYMRLLYKSNKLKM